MAKLHLLAALLLAASVVSVGMAKEETFVVEGKVYCDNCRAGFETTITEYMDGAAVKFTCMNETTGEVFQTVEGKTDATGTYHLKVKKGHEDDLCEVTLERSPKKDCSEIKVGRRRARVELTANDGISSNVRQANSLGFLRSEPLDICGNLLAQYSLDDSSA